MELFLSTSLGCMPAGIQSMAQLLMQAQAPTRSSSVLDTKNQRLGDSSETDTINRFLQSGLERYGTPHDAPSINRCLTSGLIAVLMTPEA